jgi:hypothetical protein
VTPLHRVDDDAPIRHHGKGYERLLRRLLAEALGDLARFERLARSGLSVHFEIGRAMAEVDRYERMIRLSGFAQRIEAPV